MNKRILRAITAYSRTDLKSSEGSLSVMGREAVFMGKEYVLLEAQAQGELLAIYRCMNRGELKRLKRWPIALTAKPEVATVHPAVSKALRVPAILELSPIKGATNIAPKTKANMLKTKDADVNQTDLFE